MSVTLLILLLCTFSAAAVTFTFTGTGPNANWNIASNWNQLRIPEPEDEVIIPYSASTIVRIDEREVIVKSLEIQSNAVLVLTNQLTVNETLDIKSDAQLRIAASLDTVLVLNKGLNIYQPVNVSVELSLPGGITKHEYVIKPSGVAQNSMTPTSEIAWTGAHPAPNWFEAMNWSPARLPTANDKVIIGADKFMVYAHTASVFGGAVAECLELEVGGPYFRETLNLDSKLQIGVNGMRVGKNFRLSYADHPGVSLFSEGGIYIEVYSEVTFEEDELKQLHFVLESVHVDCASSVSEQLEMCHTACGANGTFSHCDETHDDIIYYNPVYCVFTERRCSIHHCVRTTQTAFSAACPTGTICSETTRDCVPTTPMTGGPMPTPPPACQTESGEKLQHCVDQCDFKFVDCVPEQPEYVTKSATTCVFEGCEVGQCVKQQGVPDIPVKCPDGQVCRPDQAFNGGCGLPDGVTTTVMPTMPSETDQSTSGDSLTWLWILLSVCYCCYCLILLLFLFLRRTKWQRRRRRRQEFSGDGAGGAPILLEEEDVQAFVADISTDEDDSYSELAIGANETLLPDNLRKRM